jgi:hypothetical protein
MRGLILGQLFCLCHTVCTFLCGICYATFRITFPAPYVLRDSNSFYFKSCQSSYSFPFPSFVYFLFRYSLARANHGESLVIFYPFESLPMCFLHKVVSHLFQDFLVHAWFCCYFQDFFFFFISTALFFWGVIQLDTKLHVAAKN